MMLLQVFTEAYNYYLPEKRLQSIALFVILALQFFAERLQPAERKNNEAKQQVRNVLIGIFNLLILFFPSVLLVELLWWLKDKGWGLLNQFRWAGWLTLGVTILVMDFSMYWWHRLNHRVPLLWKFHRFHHLDKTMNTTTALRFHTVELLLSTLMRGIVYFLMGFNYLFILVYELIFFTVVLLHHSNIGISTAIDMQYRKVFSSPLMHRIHHSNKQKETDTNYGSVFSFWDRLFGSYRREAEGRIVFGVEEVKN